MWQGAKAFFGFKISERRLLWITNCLLDKSFHPKNVQQSICNPKKSSFTYLKPFFGTTFFRKAQGSQFYVKECLSFIHKLRRICFRADEKDFFRLRSGLLDLVGFISLAFWELFWYKNLTLYVRSSVINIPIWTPTHPVICQGPFKWSAMVEFFTVGHPRSKYKFPYTLNISCPFLYSHLLFQCLSMPACISGSFEALFPTSALTSRAFLVLVTPSLLPFSQILSPDLAQPLQMHDKFSNAGAHKSYRSCNCHIFVSRRFHRPVYV